MGRPRLVVAILVLFLVLFVPVCGSSGPDLNLEGNVRGEIGPYETQPQYVVELTLRNVGKVPVEIDYFDVVFENVKTGEGLRARVVPGGVLQLEVGGTCSFEVGTDGYTGELIAGGGEMRLVVNVFFTAETEKGVIRFDAGLPELGVLIGGGTENPLLSF